LVDRRTFTLGYRAICVSRSSAVNSLQVLGDLVPLALDLGTGDEHRFDVVHCSAEQRHAYDITSICPETPLYWHDINVLLRAKLL
jgi:hypothetical protein